MAEISVLTNIGTSITCECGPEKYVFVADRINTTVKINTLGIWTITAELDGKSMVKKAIIDDKHIDYIVELYNLDKPNQDISVDDLKELLNLINTLNLQVRANSSQIDDLKSKNKNLTDSNTIIVAKQEKLNTQINEVKKIIDNIGEISEDSINELRETIDTICVDINTINGSIDNIKKYLDDHPIPQDTLTKEDIDIIMNNSNESIMKIIADTFEGVTN